MAQVSKHPISPKVEERIYEILIEAVGKAKDKKSVVSFLKDLLSPTEQVMLGKRIAIAYLLLKDYDQRRISRILRVSLGTVSKVNTTLNLQGQGYRKIINRMFLEEKIEKLFDKLIDLTPAIPPKGGDWAKWRKKLEEEKRARRKPF